MTLTPALSHLSHQQPWARRGNISRSAHKGTEPERGRHSLWWAPSSRNCLAWNHAGSPYSSHFLCGRVCIEHPSVILSCEKWQWVLLGWSLVWMWAVTSWLVLGGPPKGNHYLKIPRMRRPSENLCQDRCSTVDTVLGPPSTEIAGSVCSQETILEWRHFQERMLQQ